jgi:hypothetical protein
VPTTVWSPVRTVFELVGSRNGADDRRSPVRTVLNSSSRENGADDRRLSPVRTVFELVGSRETRRTNGREDPF